MPERGAGADVDRAMKLLALLGLAALAVPAAAQTSAVRCSIDYAPDQACQLADTADANGTHRMVLRAGARTFTFVGHAQTGWWAGKLDGRPAMAYERNRGNVVLSTYDLKTTLSWSYPGQEHGTY
jgi:hypothetical protein